jgi:hypothetical protein
MDTQTILAIEYVAQNIIEIEKFSDKSGNLLDHLIELVKHWLDAEKEGDSDRSNEILEKFAATRKELLDSDENIPWSCAEDGFQFDVVMADCAKTALETVRENLGSYDNDETIWVDHTVTSLVHMEEQSQTIQIDPPEPECKRKAGHQWSSPIEVVGGCETNPGVFGHGGSVVVKTFCSHCGLIREVDNWAQNPQTGEQGLQSVIYYPARQPAILGLGNCQRAT